MFVKPFHTGFPYLRDHVNTQSVLLSCICDEPIEHTTPTTSICFTILQYGQSFPATGRTRKFVFPYIFIDMQPEVLALIAQRSFCCRQNHIGRTERSMTDFQFGVTQKSFRLCKVRAPITCYKFWRARRAISRFIVHSQD
jgi:hypothetical protein